MMSYWAFCPVPFSVRKTGKSRTVPMRPLRAPWTLLDENFAPGSEAYMPSGRYLSKPCEIQAASFDVPTVPVEPSRFSIPNAPGAPNALNGRVVEAPLVVEPVPDVEDQGRHPADHHERKREQDEGLAALALQAGQAHSTRSF